MYGDYYYLHETAEELGLRLSQLQGRLNTHKEMKVLFEMVFITRIMENGRANKHRHLMLHKDKLEELRHLNETRIQVSSPSPRRLYGWTESARDCQSINCNCSVCGIYHIMGDDCKMREKVKQLTEDEYAKNYYTDKPRANTPAI